MIVRNRVAYVSWGFASVVLVFLLSMTSLLFRDDYGGSGSPILIWGVLALFWLAAIGLGRYAANQPVTTVAIAVEGGLDITLRYPFRKVFRHMELTDIDELRVVESVDDEGNPYFSTKIAFVDGSFVDIKESHDRQRCEDVRDLFESVIG